MTRHPRNEVADAIDVVTAPAPVRPDQKVHRDEIEAVVTTVRGLAEEGVTGIGVLSPFRPQADELESALMDEFGVREIRDLALRVGTVHSFQGGERDVVVASLGLAESDSAGRRRFLEHPNLFNVMVTRARRRMIVVTSLPLGTAGLTGEYLRHASEPLPPLARHDGEGDGARLLECRVHPDGIDAHLERRLTLMRLGWTIVDAFPSRWERNAARAALELR